MLWEEQLFGKLSYCFGSGYGSERVQSKVGGEKAAPWPRGTERPFTRFVLGQFPPPRRADGICCRAERMRVPDAQSCSLQCHQRCSSRVHLNNPFPERQSWEHGPVAAGPLFEVPLGQRM